MDTNKEINDAQNRQKTSQGIPETTQPLMGDVADFLAGLENNYFVIKGVFAGKYSLITGLLELIGSINKGELYRVRLVASLNKDYRREMSLDLGWDSFANFVTDSLLSRKYPPNSFTQTLNDHFKRICTQEFNSQLYELINTEQLEEAEKNLRREIHKAIREEVKLEIQCEIIDLSYLTVGEATERLNNDVDEKKVSVDDFSIYLHTELIVDPLSGKTIVELQQGETVYAYIKEKTKSGIYFAQLLGALKEGQLLPVKAKVNRIEKIANDTYDRFFAEVVFGPGIAGRSIISSEIKIAIFQPVIADGETRNLNSDDAKPSDTESNNIASLDVQAQDNDLSVDLEGNLDDEKTNPHVFVIIITIVLLVILFVVWRFFSK